MPTPEAVRLRPAVAADAPAVGALTRAAYAKWVTLIGREPSPMGADHARAIREHLVDLLAEGPAGAERVVGVIEMIPFDDHLLIENLAIAPDCQKGGLGRRLLAHAEATARRLRLPTVRLYTNSLFASNLALYRRSGYAVDREEPYRGGTRVHLRKPIPPGP